MRNQLNAELRPAQHDERKPTGSVLVPQMIFSCVIALLGALPSWGALQTVTNTNDSGTGSLRDVIANAASGDTIQFNLPNPSTITLASTLTLANNLTIKGPGAAQLAISGNQSVQVFYINAGVTVAISGMTIENARNDQFYSGGGIGNHGTLTLSNSTVSNNSATQLATGGGIYNDSGAILTIDNSTISNNHADYYGGGIFNYGTLTLIGSTLSGNSAYSGGGILSQGSFSLINSTISGNSAAATLTGSGGGIRNKGGPSTITNTTITGNSAPGGGGIENEGTLTLKNTLLANNVTGANCGGPIQSLGYNLSDDKSCAALDQASDQNNVTAGLDSNGLQNNGGPTQTVLPLPGSPAICGGAPSLIPAEITTDQRGFGRTTQYSDSVTCLDIGAAQTNYQSIRFTNGTVGYSANVNQDVSPAPNLTVTENGQIRDGVPVTLSISGSPAANGLTATTANGTGATFGNLTVGAFGDYTLSATLNLTSATATPALSITTDSTPSLAINGLTATVSIGNIPASAIYGGSFTPAYVNIPSGDTGARSVISQTPTCIFSGGTVSFVGAGICTLQASIAATTVYQGATGPPQSFTIGRANATVSINNIPSSATIGGSFTPTYTVTPGDDTGGRSVISQNTRTCTISGGTVNFVGVGACILQASIGTTANYAENTGAQQTLNISYGIVVLYNQTAPATSGSTVPIKVQLRNQSGGNLSSPATVVTVTGISPSPTTGKAPSGNFTFMPTGDAGPMYQFNVKTTGYPAGSYTLSFSASGDPVTHRVQFVVQ